MALPTTLGFQLEEGDLVTLRPVGKDDRWSPGIVMFASPNGQSIIVYTFADMTTTTGHTLMAGLIPLNLDYAAGTVTGLLTSDQYEIGIADATATRPL